VIIFIEKLKLKIIMAYKCTKCGKVEKSSGSVTRPPSDPCPKGGLHKWERISRFVKRIFDAL
jgi:hypothetical protein